MSETQSTGTVGPRRILSGVQPSGKLHLGNYFGAIRNHIKLQSEGQPFYFIADYHALTTIQDPKILREYVHEVAIAYLSLGLDPERATFFRQSDVPQVTELTWLLSTVTGMGLLERAHSYKDKVARGLQASAGLFLYPVLMAADILAYQSDLVPVGQDQVQHIEMTQDMAQYFNSTYGVSTFRRPDWVLDVIPKVPGIDGQKMSKSYGNTIEIFASGNKLKKSVMKIVTDSLAVEEPKDPEKCTVFALYSLIADRGEIDDLALRYRAGGLGYGQVKKELFERLQAFFAPFREKREELLKASDFVEEVLQKGAQRAGEEAQRTLDAARKACGLS